MESGNQQYVFSMESDGYQFSKLIGCLLVTSGVARIVQGVVQTNVVDETFRERALTKIGSFAIGAMVSEKVWNHTEEKLDRFHRLYKKAQKEWEDAKPVESKVSNE